MVCAFFTPFDIKQAPSPMIFRRQLSFRLLTQPYYSW